MNELTLSATNAPAKFTFKNQQLNKISAKIAEQSAAMNDVYNAAKEGAEAVNKALAPLFGELMASKCYKDDGFKSVADYAEQTFNMGKSMAYMLARVGEAYYNTASEDAKLARETLSTAKLAELTGVDKKQVGDAIKSGELGEGSSLAACRDFATTHKKPGKEKVVQTFTVNEYSGKGNGAVIAENVTKDEMFAAIIDYTFHNWGNNDPVMFTPAKFEGDKPSAVQHFVAYTKGGFCEMYEYRPYVKPAIKYKGKPKGEKFDLAAYIASLSPDERAALAAMVAGKDDEHDEYTLEEVHKEAGLF